MNVIFTLWRDKKKVVKNSFSFCGCRATAEVWPTCYQMHMCCYVDRVGVSVECSVQHWKSFTCKIIETLPGMRCNRIFKIAVGFICVSGLNEEIVILMARNWSSLCIDRVTDIHMWRWCENSLYCSTPMQRIDISWHITHLPFGGNMTIIQSGYKPS